MLELRPETIEEMKKSYNEVDYMARWRALLEPYFQEMREVEKQPVAGKVYVPNSFFIQMPIQDYTNPTQALAREFLQNSLDAKADLLKISGTKENICIEDNGKGMDKETLLHKLLALGGSQKDEGSTGGFGKAKELLYFCWASYMVHSHEHLVFGYQGEYTYVELPQELKKRGTASFIETWHDENVCKKAFADKYCPSKFKNGEGLLESFQGQTSKTRTKCSVFINNEKYATLNWGRKIHAQDNMTIYRNKTGYDEICVLVNGLHMFSTYSPDGAQGSFYVNFEGDSKELLSSNRDSLKNRYLEIFDSWRNQLAADVISMVNEAPEEVLSFFEDSHEIEKPQREVVLAQIKQKHDNNFLNIEEKISDDEVYLSETKSKENQGYLVAQEEVKTFTEEAQKPKAVFVRDDGRLVKEIRHNKSFAGYRAMAIETGKEHDAKRILAKKVNCEKFSRLIYEGLAACVDAYEDIFGEYPKLKYGLIFSWRTLGRFSSKGTEKLILINPLDFENLFQEWNKQNVYTSITPLLHLCIHEVAHLAVSNHNEDFTSTMYKLTKKVYELHPYLEKQMANNALSPVRKHEKADNNENEMREY